MKRKIKMYRWEVSFYENKEERNGIDVVKFKEIFGMNSDVGEKNYKIRRIKRGKNEVNGDMEREDDDDEGEKIFWNFCCKKLCDEMMLWVIWLIVWWVII